MHEVKLVVIATLLCGGLSAADFAACPAQVGVQEQQLSKAAPGWTAGHAADVRHDLWFVTLYDGEPKDKASLVPDVNNRQKQSWALPHQSRAYWLECHYTRTTVVLAKPLPASVQACEVTFTPSESLDGHQAIKQMVCR
jgi:hypothetical protein